MKTKTLGILALAYLMLALFGCTHAAAQIDTPTALLSSPSPTQSRTLTVAQIATSMAVNQQTDTLNPSITSTPILSTPVSAPLSQNGPWMLLSRNTAYMGPVPIIGPVFSNVDGSAWEPANLPRDPLSPPDEPDWWFGSVAPKGPYAAFQNYLSEYYPECERDTTTHESHAVQDNTLYILKLPENRVIQKFQMFGTMAFQQIQKDECIFAEQKEGNISSVLGVVQNVSSLHWSPDGRYLAFPAAPDSPAADLYLYDTQTNKISPLTHRQNNPDILGWSPDGQEIIYRGVTIIHNENNVVLESSGLYAVSITGIDRLLIKPKSVPGMLKWLSQSQFVITDGLCDVWQKGYCKTTLLLFDLTNSKREVLYEDPRLLANYEADPIHHQLLLMMPTLPDLQQFDLETRSFHHIPVRDVPYLDWDAKLQAFRYDNLDDMSSVLHTTLIRYVPSKGFTVEKVDNLPDPSPDGQWSVGWIGADQYIFNAQNQPIQKMSGNRKGSWTPENWSPDSSCYIQLTDIYQAGETLMMVYQKQNNWEPVLARRIIQSPGWWFQWIMQ